MQKSINKLQKGKAPESDGLPAEFFKTFLPILVDPLTDMFRESLESGRLPHSLEVATFNVFSKEDKDERQCSSYRPLFLLNVSFKVQSKLLAGDSHYHSNPS